MLNEANADDVSSRRDGRNDRHLPGRRRFTVVACGLALAALIGTAGQDRLAEAGSGLSQMFSSGALEQSRLAAVRPFLAGGRSEADWLSDTDLDWRVQPAKLSAPVCDKAVKVVPAGSFARPVELELPRAL